MYLDNKEFQLNTVVMQLILQWKSADKPDWDEALSFNNHNQLFLQLCNSEHAGLDPPPETSSPPEGSFTYDVHVGFNFEVKQFSSTSSRSLFLIL